MPPSAGVEAQVVIAALFNYVPRKVVLMDALHDDDFVPCLRIVQTCGHGLVPPLQRPRPYSVGLRVLHVMGIVRNDVVAAFARKLPADGRCQPIAAFVVFEALLDVLVSRQAE